MTILRVLPDHWKAAFFVRNQRRPHGLGYSTYRRLQLESCVRRPMTNLDALPPGYGRWMDERVVEYPWLLSRLPARDGVLLDAGSVLNFDFILAQPVFQNKKLFLCTLAPEEKNFPHRGISYVYEDLRSTCYRDSFFDWVVSLSTLEHIGLDNTRLYTNDPT